MIFDRVVLFNSNDFVHSRSSVYECGVLFPTIHNNNNIFEK